jgi:hypothetical protein
LSRYIQEGRIYIMFNYFSSPLLPCCIISFLSPFYLSHWLDHPRLANNWNLQATDSMDATESTVYSKKETTSVGHPVFGDIRRFLDHGKSSSLGGRTVGEHTSCTFASATVDLISTPHLHSSRPSPRCRILGLRSSSHQEDVALTEDTQ